MPGSGCQEVVDDFSGLEGRLFEQWNHYDFFVLHLNRHSFRKGLGEELARSEWIEILDAWLPGLIACLGPRVFALIGDIRKRLAYQTNWKLRQIPGGTGFPAGLGGNGFR